jgi:hypothetical protein
VEPVSARIFQSIVLAPGTNVLISWPISAAAFQLQSSSNLLGSWVNVATPLTTNGNQISTLVPLQGSQQFFRLKQ